MINITDNERAMAAEIQRLNNEATAHEVTCDNLRMERDELEATNVKHRELLVTHLAKFDELTAEIGSFKLLDEQRLESLRAIEQERNALKQIKDEAWEAAKGVRQRLEDECDALRADADRYRYLRDAKTLDQWIWDALEQTEGETHAAYCKGLDAAVDAAVDAAMKGGQP